MGYCSMSLVDRINKILTEGCRMVDNVTRPTLDEHRSMEYVESAAEKLREAGLLVHGMTPKLTDMIQFVHESVPEQYHGNINHAWSGIGEWVS